MASKITYRDFIEVGQQMQGITRCKQTLIEALDITCEKNPSFPKEDFCSAVIECLYENGVLREASFFELCLLDSKIMAKDGRNYKMKDLLDAVASLYMIREVFPRTTLELVKNDTEFRSA